MKKSREAFCIVFVTASSRKEARTIARAVLGAKLATCVNIVPGVESHFWWQGKMDTANEHLLVIKSARRHLTELTKVVKETHSYETPEIVALPVIAAERAYARWWRKSLS